MTYEDFEAQRFRRDLKDLEDYIFDLPLMLLSMRKTAKALSFEADLWERRHDIACPPGNESQIVFRGIVDEIDLLIKRVDILEKRVKTLSGIYQDTLSHEIAKDTKNDSSAVRIITMITVLFLPATFVAVRLEMSPALRQILISADILFNGFYPRRKLRPASLWESVGLCCHYNSSDLSHSWRVLHGTGNSE